MNQKPSGFNNSPHEIATFNEVKRLIEKIKNQLSKLNAGAKYVRFLDFYQLQYDFDRADGFNNQELAYYVKAESNKQLSAWKYQFRNHLIRIIKSYPELYDLYIDITTIKTIRKKLKNHARGDALVKIFDLMIDKIESYEKNNEFYTWLKSHIKYGYTRRVIPTIYQLEIALLIEVRKFNKYSHIQNIEEAIWKINRVVKRYAKVKNNKDFISENFVRKSGVVACTTHQNIDSYNKEQLTRIANQIGPNVKVIDATKNRPKRNPKKP